MSLFVKICGMTTPAAVSAAVACKVDAIGFVFAQSVRRVTPQRATELAAPARHQVACAAVMRHPTRAEVDDVLREFRPDFLQTDIEDLDTLGLPRELAVLPVLRPGPKPACAIPRRVLFEGPVSGSGLVRLAYGVPRPPTRTRMRPGTLSTSSPAVSWTKPLSL